MMSHSLHLIHKIQLTYDVYELVYAIQDLIDIIPGQFFLCETEKSHPHLRRAYSVSYIEQKNIHFIIKRVVDGRGGSKAICDQKIGHVMQAWGPTGIFTLPTIIQPSDHLVFIGTGTGFAPLYFQAKTLLEKNPLQKIAFIFGVREEKDLFYTETFLTWTQQYPHFSGHFCLSKIDHQLPSGYFPGRVTEYLHSISEYLSQNEIYSSICGNPAMVREVRNILHDMNIDSEKVFFEQY